MEGMVIIMTTQNKKLNRKFLHIIGTISIAKNMFIQGCIISLLMIVLITTNFWSINMINNQLVETNQKLLKLYMNKLDEQLYDVEKQMARFIIDNKSKFRDFEKKDEESPYVAKKIDEMLATTFSGYQEMDGFFVYNAQQDRFISYDISNQFFKNSAAVSEWFKNQCRYYEKNKTTDTRHWICKKMNDDYSLIRIMKTGHFYVGAYVKTDRLLKMVDDEYKKSYEHLIFKDENDTFMTSKQFELLNPIGIRNKNALTYSLEDGSKYTAIERNSAIAPIKLVAFHKNTALILGLQGMQIIVFLLANTFLIFMGGLVLYTRRNLIKPISSLVAAMEKVKQGDLEVQITDKAHYHEFQTLFERFNSMVSEIRTLKIDVYEKKINNQKTLLKFLKLQINPHFFLNSMNVIYSLALTQNVTMIKELVVRLMRHSRFLLKVNQSMIPIKDELGHVDNYIEIQKMRYSFQLKYVLETEDEVEEYRIPPMVIYTFVENSAKYGLREEFGEVIINVKVKIVQIEEKEYIDITIQDNGPGFTNEMLIDQLNSGEIILDSQGDEHYGIANVKHRLEIIYGTEASIQFSNTEQAGALIHMRIPSIIMDETILS